MNNIKSIDSFLNKKSRKKKDTLAPLPSIYINRDAGDVETNVNAFNSATTTGNPMAMGEGYMKDLYMDVEDAGGKERYLKQQALKLKNRERKLLGNRSEKERKKLESEIEEIKTNMSIVDPKPIVSKETIQRIKDEIADYEHQLQVDVDGIPNWRYYLERKIKKLKDQLSELEMKESLMNIREIKENLRNVVDVEPKSREVVDPAFAQAVREIKHNDKMRDFVNRLRKAPKEGKETLPSDLKITLDESLFIAEEVGYVIKDVGIDASGINDDIIVGTVYGYEGDTDYEDDFTFKYNKDTDEITFVEIDPIFTDAERGIIKELLKDNIKTNFKESLKEDYEKETLESCKDGFGNEIKVGDTIVGIDYYKDITIGKIVEITKEYDDITMVNFDDGKHSFIHGLINTAVYKFDKKYGYIYGYKDSKLKPTLTDKREDISDALASFSEWSADMYGQGGEKVFKAFDKNGEILFDELSEKLEESAQLNEGAGAGYTIEGELYNIVVNKINSIEIHNGKTAFGSPTQFAKINLDADALFDGFAESYYYGDRIDDAKVKITSLNVNPNLIYDLGLKEFEYDKIELQDLNDRLGFGSTLKFKSDVIGGGWSHSTFDGNVEANKVDDDYMPYVDGIKFHFVDDAVIDYIDSAVKGETGIEDIDESVESDTFYALINHSDMTDIDFALVSKDKEELIKHWDDLINITEGDIGDLSGEEYFNKVIAPKIEDLDEMDIHFIDSEGGNIAPNGEHLVVDENGNFLFGEKPLKVLRKSHNRF